MNLVSYKMKKFWFVTLAYIRPVHGPYTQPLGRGRSNRVSIKAACHGEENNLFERKSEIYNISIFINQHF